MTAPQPDAEATPEIRAAMLQCERLLRLVRFPIHVESTAVEPRSLDNWELVAPAMLFSATSCLFSIRLLAGVVAPRREQDAWVLLRRLYEHAVDFAWIAINPSTHAPRWVADDYSYRLKIDDDMKTLGQPGMLAATRTAFEQYVQAHPKMPNLLQRTVAADAYWSTRLPDHGTFPTSPAAPGQSPTQAQGGHWSFRGLYTLIYRSGSAAAHPTPMSLHTYVGPGGGPNRFSIGMNPNDQSDRFGYTFAPLVYATMLLVSEQVLGVPKAADVTGAFEP